MRPEDFVEDSPGEIEMVDGIFTYSPDPLPPGLDPSHDLVTQNGEAMYALGQLSDLETWLDSPEVILSPLVHREAADSSSIETISRVTLSDLYRREAGEDVGTTEPSAPTSPRRPTTSTQHVSGSNSSRRVKRSTGRCFSSFTRYS